MTDYPQNNNYNNQSSVYGRNENLANFSLANKENYGNFNKYGKLSSNTTFAPNQYNNDNITQDNRNSYKQNLYKNSNNYGQINEQFSNQFDQSRQSNFSDNRSTFDRQSNLQKIGNIQQFKVY
ncbi:hypothetical protein PPERSA_01551 [Pseudocohnilembus persalinus]|uniref:Uncharacterized protein n=1 Tax=Pseudocohnilembus persalinus TaxID=266149 RepID=A0A0V0QHD3_PSEPJ|nr:hypothetical protein PPERSA_01551 [Pseudocohnilembus persalinus]|eukprot:KRX01681.1 hypothetical protein PPERSA_01551 [Pseudocohnilembus persalinus]